MQKSNWNNKKIGAFWIKKTKVDKQYLSGFKNDFKKDQSPDFQVYQI